MPDLVERLVACGAVRYGDFTLTSGRKSRYYVDVKRALTDPGTLRAIAAEAAAWAGPADMVAGMELGAVPLATAVSLEAGLPLLMIRKGERGHGTGKRIEGPDPEGKRVLLVEDVATTGGSTVAAADVLRAAGAQVTEAIVVVDREEGAAAALAAAGIPFSALVPGSALLARAPAEVSS